VAQHPSGSTPVKSMEALRWSSGTKAAAQGTDLATVARGLDMPQLRFWLEKLQHCSCRHEAAVLQAEIDRRDPAGAWGTLWQSVLTPEGESS